MLYVVKISDELMEATSGSVEIKQRLIASRFWVQLDSVQSISITSISHSILGFRSVKTCFLLQ